MPPGTPRASQRGAVAPAPARPVQDFASPHRFRPFVPEAGRATNQGKVHLDSWVASESRRRRSGEAPLLSPAPRPPRNIFSESPVSRSDPPLLWGLTGIFLLAAHLLRGEFFGLPEAGILLGVNFSGKKGGEAPGLDFLGTAQDIPIIRSGDGVAFTWRDQLRLWTSGGLEKIALLQGIGGRLERGGLLREARERYEAAVDLAERMLQDLSPRGPDNRRQAGEVHRALGSAYLSLAAFWDRRADHRSLAIENYEMAFKYLSPLGGRSARDQGRLETAASRLQALHLAEAEHWSSQGELARAGTHFEAAGDFAIPTEAAAAGRADLSPTLPSRIEYWRRAARAYARARSPRYEDFARVMVKIHREEG
ncbi:hypothetical protein FBR05_03950 [Deltaproteobacteria bacterium PRO3]|nr:hypothetical protein [Deltaproteobacteria bacterium PRO3]